MSNLTVQQQLFCQKYIEHKGNASEAYRQAYNPKNPDADWVRIEACKMLQDPNISLTVETLQAEHKQRHAFTIDDAVREYDEARMIAAAENQAAPMISATKAKCDLFGLDAPKKVNIEGTLGEWLSERWGDKS